MSMDLSSIILAAKEEASKAKRKPGQASRIGAMRGFSGDDLIAFVRAFREEFKMPPEKGIYQQHGSLKYANLEVPVRWKEPNGGAFIDLNDLPEDLRQAFFEWMLGATVFSVKGAYFNVGYMPHDFDDFMKRHGVGASGDFSAIVEKYV